MAAQERYDQIARLLPPPEFARLEFFAQVAEAQELQSLSAAEALRGQHCWRDEVIAQRFDWGKAKNIFALAVRVFRLPNPIELPVSPRYGGCKSWLELEQDIPIAGATPVLTQPVFDQKLSRFLAALHSVETPAV